MSEENDELLSDEELRVCVEVYADVVKRGGASRDMPKDLYLVRPEKRLPGRNRNALYHRMQNIIHVQNLNDKSVVTGWGPKPHG